MTDEPKQPSPEQASEIHDAEEFDATSEDDAFDRLLELVATEPQTEPPQIPERIAGIVIGRVVDVTPPRIAWAGAAEGARAKSLVPLEAQHIGREVALMFDGQDPSRPVVTGIVERFGEPASAEARGKLQVVVEAPDELVLRAGAASITLTRAGKILIRGAYVSSTATGTHRIRGGAVEIN